MSQHNKQYGKKVVKRKQAAKRANPAQYKRVQRKLPREIKRQVMKPHISQCAQEYIASLVNPFDQNLMPCVPSFFPIPSQKSCTWLKGTFALGTTGFGYVLARATLDNDTNASVIATQSTSVGGVLTNLSAFTLLVSAINTNNQYTNTQLVTQENVQGRVVSYGLRVRYLGREDARNGTVMMCETLDREDLNTRNFTGISAFQNATKTVPDADRNWISACFSGPSDPDDIDFRPTGLPLGASYPIVACISGTAGDQYEYEYIQHIEYAGRQALSKTPSHADQKGFDVAIQQVKTVANNKAIEPEKDGPGILSRFVSGMWEHSGAIMEAGKTLGGILSMDPSSVLRTALTGLTQSSRQSGMSGLLGGSSRLIGY